jgi:transcriptional regulator with XRE-family HTH domain
VFDQVFCARIRAARRARGLSQADVAQALGISRAAYTRYETHTPLPHHLVLDFVELTGADYVELLAEVETQELAEGQSAA